MAVDKKGDYVGTHGGAYTDENGMSRQFTYVDHDRHTSRLKTRETEVEKKERERKASELHAEVKAAQIRRVDEILALPAVAFAMSGNTYAEDCIIRDLEKGIIWDETYVRNFLDIRSDMITPILNSCWKNTVKEQFWFDEMSHEDILAGKWKELM